MGKGKKRETREKRKKKKESAPIHRFVCRLFSFLEQELDRKKKGKKKNKKTKQACSPSRSSLVQSAGSPREGEKKKQQEEKDMKGKGARKGGKKGLPLRLLLYLLDRKRKENTTEDTEIAVQEKEGGKKKSRIQISPPSTALPLYPRPCLPFLEKKMGGERKEKEKGIGFKKG